MLTETRLRTIEITINDIKMILNSLNRPKACGPDNITITMLLLCVESIILPLQHIFHDILRSGVYPEAWKEANVPPVHKNENKQIVNNYCPFSLLPICVKILFKYLFNHPISENLITNEQSAFRPVDSTTNKLIQRHLYIYTFYAPWRSGQGRGTYFDKFLSQHLSGAVL